MNSMSKPDGPGAQGHEYVMGQDRRTFPGGTEERGSRLAAVERTAGEAVSAAGRWLWGSPLLTLAVLVGAGYLASRLLESRR
jgi:hypothetical protein